MKHITPSQTPPHAQAGGEAAVAAIRAPARWTPTGPHQWTVAPLIGPRHTLRSVPTGFRDRRFELDGRGLLASPAEVDAAIADARAREIGKAMA